MSPPLETRTGDGAADSVPVDCEEEQNGQVGGDQKSDSSEAPGVMDLFEYQARLVNTSPIASHKRGVIVSTADRIQRLLPAGLRPEKGFLASFKNRILVGALAVIIGVVIIIGVTLQVTVFPRLEGESAIVTNLKAVHFLASIMVIALGWLFIELISKRITLPLQELTKRADEISREAGAGIDSTVPPTGNLEGGVLQEEGNGNFLSGDEIYQLTSSFNRMLVHLKASEAQLRESEEKYRFLFDNGPLPIFVIDADDLMILDVNARAEHEYQFTKEEFLAMSFAALGVGRDRERTSAHLKLLLSTEVTLLPVLQQKRKDGSIFMVNFQGRLSRYRNHPAIIAAVWDVTERLEKHAKLIQAGKMATLGEMATGIAHELNQPLNVIMLGCDYLDKKVRLGRSVTPEDLRQVTRELATNVERAARIINHLRQFGRKADGTMSSVDVNIPIASVFNLVGTQLEARGIKWDLLLEDDLPSILGDINRLEQVFINLVLNARDAILSQERKEGQGDLPPRVITVRSFLENERVVVTVADTGPGIPEALKSKVFEPFFTTKKTGEGTGLGLSISYGIIKEHNGTIEIDENAEGTTFRLTFPALSDGDPV